MPKYKDHEIILGQGGLLVCHDLGLSAETYKELCALIDKELRREYQPVQAIYMSYNDDSCEVVKITRPHGEGGGRVWITYQNGKRETVSINRLIEFSPGNLAKVEAAIKRVQGLQERINAAQDVIDNLPRARIIEEVK